MNGSVKKCVIHIGMHKTGTTSLQRSLSKIDIPGWQFLSLSGHISLTVPFFAMFDAQPERWHWFKKRGIGRADAARKGARWRAEFLQLISGDGLENLLISGEGIPYIAEDGIRRLKNFLAPHFDEIKIVAYVRSPVAFLNSMLQQDIKAGSKNLNLREILYRERFEKFDKVFGKENVQLWKFDPARFLKNCTVTDFCAKIGIPLPENSVVRVNESLSREACGLLLAYRKFGPGYGVGKNVMRENDTIVEALYQVSGEKFKLARELVEPMLDQIKDDISWVEQRLGESLLETDKPGKSDIHGENELLQVSAKTCQDFASAFQKVTDIDVRECFPTEGTVDPRAVASMVERCRDELRAKFEGGDKAAASADLSNTDAQFQNPSTKPEKSENAKVVVRIEIADLVSELLAVNGSDDADEMKAVTQGSDAVEAAAVRILENIREKVAAASDGETVSVVGLGQFRIKTTPKTNAGKRPIERKIVFVAAKNPGNGVDERSLVLLETIRKKIAIANDGDTVSVAGLGRFRIKLVTRNGADGNRVVRKVFFSEAKPGEKKGVRWTK